MDRIKSVDWFDLAFKIFIVVLVVSIVVGCTMAMLTENNETEFCVKNDYDFKKVGGQVYCIGVRNGNTVTFPASDLQDQE